MTRHAVAHRRALAALLAAATLATPLGAAAPASFPTKPVKLIVPFAPGGPTDTVARLVAEQLQAEWKQPVIVDCKPAAGTIVGTDFVAKSAPDGYTLGMAISAHMINPALQPRLPYDTLRDLTGVAQVAQAYFGLFAHPTFPADNEVVTSPERSRPSTP
jgi:tripartite-type tricarboxylate transporter receptor subunit TctC